MCGTINKKRSRQSKRVRSDGRPVCSREFVLLGAPSVRDCLGLRQHGHCLHVRLERLGLLENIILGALEVVLGIGALVAFLFVDALGLELFCACFLEGLYGFRCSVALLLELGVFRKFFQWRWATTAMCSMWSCTSY